MTRGSTHVLKMTLAFGIIANGTVAISQSLGPTERSWMKENGAQGHYTATGERGSNDECAGAISLTVNTECTPTDGDLSLATESMAAITCNGYTADVANDLWYSFTATGVGTIFQATGGPDIDPIIEVFSGDCGALVSEGCADGTLVNETEAVAFATTPGGVYYARVYFWPYNTPPTDYSFSVCVYSAPDPPVNDACSGVTPETLTQGTPLTFNGTTAGATINGDFAQPDVNTHAAVWHAVTITEECSDLTIDLCGTSPAFTNGYGIIDTSCPSDTATQILYSTVNNTSCDDGNFTVIYYGVPAGTYYLPVWSELGVAYGPYTLNVSSAPCIPPPANDDCEGAIALTPSATCVPVDGTTFLATETQPADSCNGYLGAANDDVWYMFTATASDMDISVQGGDGFDAVVELFEGSCGAFTEIDCADATVGGELEEIQHTGFTVGNTYYVRLFHYSESAPTASTFTICVVESSGIGFRENEAPIAWSVYPNPSTGDLNIAYGDASGRATVDVLDMSGRVIASQQLTVNSGGRHAIQLNDRLAAGSYTVRITTASGSNAQRVVVR